MIELERSVTARSEPFLLLSNRFAKSGGASSSSRRPCLAGKPLGEKGDTTQCDVDRRLVPDSASELALKLIEGLTAMTAPPLRNARDPDLSWGFTGRAPEAMVAKERDKLAANIADRDELAARLAHLRGA